MGVCEKKCSLWSICGCMSLDVLDVPWCSPLFLFSSIPFSRERGKVFHRVTVYGLWYEASNWFVGIVPGYVLSPLFWVMYSNLRGLCFVSGCFSQYMGSLICLWWILQDLSSLVYYVFMSQVVRFLFSLWVNITEGVIWSVCVCQRCNAWYDCAFMSQDVGTTAVCRHLSQDVRSLICWVMFVQGWDF